MARKKQTGRARAVTAYDEGGFRLPLPASFREHPLDAGAMCVAALAAGAIAVNALMFQTDGTLKPSQPVAMKIPAAAPKPVVAPQTPVTIAAPAPAEDPSMLVREVQAELSRRGIYDGPADGVFGPRTEAAIFDFEIGAGLKPTGRPNPQLLASMRAETSPVIAPSSRVATVQKALQMKGFGPVKADGVMGEATRSAIRRFEASRRLPQKGEITPALLRQLSAATGLSMD